MDEIFPCKGAMVIAVYLSIGKGREVARETVLSTELRKWPGLLHT